MLIQPGAHDNAGGERELLEERLPGDHGLQLLLGNEDLEPQEPRLFSEKIRITVQ